LINGLEIAFNRLEDYKRSLLFCDLILEIDSQNPQAVFIKGLSYKQLGQNDQAFVYLKKASTFDDFQLECYHEMGGIYETLNDNTMAIKMYKKVLLKDRNHRDCLVSLSNLLMKYHQYERALKYLQHG
jgi:tetratricopeptide (TPR) repeat protein